MTDKDTSVLTMTEEELEAETERVAEAFLEHRGYQVLDSCSSHIVAREGDQYVVVGLRGEVDESGDMPDLALDEDDIELLRSSCLLYAAGHPEVTSIRADVVAIALATGHRARLRHLIGASSWAEV